MYSQRCQEEFKTGAQLSNASLHWAPNEVLFNHVGELASYRRYRDCVCCNCCACTDFPKHLNTNF